ncbi:hypothetical protein DL771_003766 [Monosporascus sp. 5C6A]|nr:hypothetical protein DL771_003766 [Monosporascus sp. 5C6A]
MPPSFMRIHYTEIIRGQLVESIRYMRVPLGALSDDWLYPDTDRQFSGFTSGGCNVTDLVWDEATGFPAAFNTHNVHIAGVEACHLVSIDYFEQEVSQLPFTKLRGRRSDTLWLVTHHLLPVPVLVKIAEVPPVDLVEKDIVVCTTLERNGITPRFLAHATEGGRIVGFLAEYVKGRAADGRDFPLVPKPAELARLDVAAA